MGRRDFVPPFCCPDFRRRQLAKPAMQRPSPRHYTERRARQGDEGQRNASGLATRRGAKHAIATEAGAAPHLAAAIFSPYSDGEKDAFAEAFADR
ncbi:hypothetical protein MES4922_40068 [Mesorhizobium ventifaucium]|uniref:Uncharacterized protein n=1 Tax=Mesorhizobium ventifaucium TaxID=666020 RepID=A0ABM9E7L9_9HYPH|nr:hypothetical protein MES4922_40068 [Mesorhizobium ventifaucium]